jgi:hypothetical protein
MKRLKRWPWLAGLLITILATTVGATARPSPASAATPSCIARIDFTTFQAQGSCTGGDPAIPYRVVLLCVGNIADPLGTITGLSVSPWTPTTQPISDVDCHLLGGFPYFASADVGSAPPPPSANMICESGRNAFRCDLPNQVPGVQISWSINGGRVTAWDNLTHVSGGCQAGTAVSVLVFNSASIATSSWRSCRSGPWL